MKRTGYLLSLLLLCFLVTSCTGKPNANYTATKSPAPKKVVAPEPIAPLATSTPQPMQMAAADTTASHQSMNHGAGLHSLKNAIFGSNGKNASKLGKQFPFTRDGQAWVASAISPVYQEGGKTCRNVYQRRIVGEKILASDIGPFCK